jgi:hypothetical protein
MSDRIDLDSRAQDVIAESIYDMKTLDLDALRETAQERCHDEADNAVIYHHWAGQILDEYESEAYRIGDPDDMLGDRTYKAGEWMEARTACAYAVALTILEYRVGIALQEIEEAADGLLDSLANVLGDDAPGEVSDLAVTRDCPHGWAAHDREDEAGTHFWLSGQLDGCDAIALKAAGIWLSYTWTPAKPGTQS